MTQVLSPLPQGWSVSLLDNVALRGSGHTPNKKHPEYWNGGVLWVSLTDSSSLDDGYISQTKKEISHEGIKNSSAVLHPAGTVIISRDAGVGKSAILGKEMAVSQHFIVWRCDGPDQLHNWFLYNWLQFWKKEFERQAIGSTIKTIGLPYFKKLKIAYPPYGEQKRIAEILSTWDRAIEVVEGLIESSQAQKKALMQQLLTGKKRLPGFEGEWKKLPLGDIFSFSRGRGISKSDLSPDGQEKCVLYGELYTKYSEVIGNVISRTATTVGVKSRDGDILIPASTTTTGIDLANATAILEDNVYLGGDINILRTKKKNTCASFFARYLTHTRKHEIARKAQGITIIHLYGNHLKPIIVDLPLIEEQKAITEVLDASDHEIVKYQQQLTRLKSEKSALMQQLLIGKRRVKIDKEAAA